MKNKLIVFFLISLFISCRKEKLKDLEEKLLIGVWKVHISCNNLGCYFVSADRQIKLDKKGNLVYTEEPEGVEEHAQIKRLRLIEDPIINYPQVSYLFEMEIRKKNVFSKIDNLKEYKYIRYLNGYFDPAGNFIQQEAINLAKEAEYNSPKDRFFIRKN